MDPAPAEAEPASAVGDEEKSTKGVEAQLEITSDTASTNTLDIDTGSAAPPPVRDPRICGVCNKEPGKYKCPRCTIKYCSVACNRTHNENHPPPTQPAQKPAPLPPPDADRNPKKDDPYSVLLDHRTELDRLFQKYPNLEDELARIHVATLPPSDNNTPGGGGGGLPWKVRVPGQAHKEPWSRDVGLRTGAAALRKARTDPGDAGDAVREYSELVLHLLSRSGAADDAAGVVRREVAAEEARTVERLLAEEASRDRG